MPVLKGHPAARAITFALVAAASLAFTSASVGASDSWRQEVQASFLMNFTKFVTWPEEAFAHGTTPISIGIIGEDPFGPAIEAAVKGQRVDGRAIEVSRIGSRDDPSKYHVVFVAASEERQLPAILRRLEKAPVLVVSDIERFCQSGGTIGFLSEGNRVRFEINLVGAERARVKISTRLLALAAKVHQ